MQGWRFLQNHYTLAVGSVNAAAADCCMKLSRMTAAPTAKTTAVKQATVKARIFFLLIIKSLAQLQVASLAFGSRTPCSGGTRKHLGFEGHKGSSEQTNS